MNILLRIFRRYIAAVSCAAAITLSFGVMSQENIAVEDSTVSDVEWVKLAKTRSKQRWDALVEGRFEDVYRFLSPSQRKVMPFDMYRRGIFGHGVWTGAEVENATCDEVRCVVATRVHTKLMHPRLTKPIVSNELIKEAWIKEAENMQLWFVPNK